MSLKLDLTLHRDEIFFQGDIEWKLSLKNEGKKDLSIPDPVTWLRQPVLRVFEPTSGKTVLLRKEASPMSDMEIPLIPGNSMETGGSIREFLPTLDPGMYEIRAVVQYENGLKTAESLPSPFRVNGSPVRDLVLDTRKNSDLSVLWVDSAGTLMRGSVSACHGGGISFVEEVGSIGIGNVAEFSLPPNGEYPDRRWICWMAEGKLKARHFSPELGWSDVVQSGLPDPDCRIVAPFHSTETKDTGKRSGGEILLLKGGDSPSLIAVQISSGRMEEGGQVDWHGPPPLWMMNHNTARGGRFVTMILETLTGFRLVSREWSVAKIGSETILEEWEGTFVSAGATLRNNGVVSGAILYWVESEEERNLEVLSWERDEKGAFRDLSSTEIDWLPDQPVSEALVRVSGTGKFAGVFSDSAGTKYLLEASGNPVALADAVQAPGLPLDVAFLEGDEPPVLVYGDPVKGILISMVDGSPLPPELF